MTNAERIRQMTDDELLAFLKNFEENNDSYISYTLCTTYDTGRCVKFHDNCDECLLSWLKEEVTDD